MNSLVDLLRRRAAESPGAIAVVSGAEQLSYGDLDRASDLAARALAAAGVGPGGLIGLLVERDLETIVSLLAILKCAAAYVPLDPEYPLARNLFIAEDSKVSCIVGARSTAQSIGLLDDRFIERTIARGDSAPADIPWPCRSDPDTVAYVIYTSGSTGQPKGCVITHGNVLALLDGALPLFDFRPQDRWAVFHSLCFDFSVWELWGALATGATAVLVPWQTAQTPAEFVGFLLDERITVLNQVPSVFRYVDREHSRRGRPELSTRYVIFGGEGVDLDVVRTFAGGAGSAAPELVNMYGITENTVHSTFKRLDAEALSARSASPIGRPLPHVGAHILDERREPVDDGAEGELWLSGPGLSQGYLDRDELNRERFASLRPAPGVEPVRCYRTGDLVRRLPGGELEYRGRNDDQVKIRGFRIELREIEAALTVHPEVLDAVVAAMDTNAGPTLVACLVCAEPYSAALAASVRAHLAATLPGHMVPRLYQAVDRVPLTQSGKRDRAAVARLFSPAGPAG